MRLEPVSDDDLVYLERVLNRPLRGVAGVAWRNPFGEPGVIATPPRLPDGTPFPTTFYLTCPYLNKAISRLESEGAMAEMNERLAAEEELQSRYAAAHADYVARREEVRVLAGLGDVPEVDRVSAGGMPGRVKCLHALVGHSLAVGPGVQPFGDEALELMGDVWTERA